MKKLVERKYKLQCVKYRRVSVAGCILIGVDMSADHIQEIDPPEHGFLRVRCHRLQCETGYSDACHLCYKSR